MIVLIKLLTKHAKDNLITTPEYQYTSAAFIFKFNYKVFQIKLHQL